MMRKTLALLFCIALGACLSTSIPREKPLAAERPLQHVVCDIYIVLMAALDEHHILYNNIKRGVAQVVARDREYNYLVQLASFGVPLTAEQERRIRIHQPERVLVIAQLRLQRFLTQNLLSEILSARTILRNNPTGIGYDHCVGEEV